MTVMDGFMPSSCFKEEFHEPMGFEHIIPSQSHQKPRRPQMPHKPVDKPVEDYRFYVALVMVEDGSIQLRCSQEMKPFKGVVLEDSARRFKDVYSDYIQQPGPSKRHRSTHHSPSTFIPFPPCPRKSGKRRHAGHFRGTHQPFFMRSEPDMDVKQPIQTGRQLQIRVDDKKAQEKWFSDAFKAVQQVGCRTIAKVWIKKIHPKKQSTHPYNGGFPRDQQADPDRTRPPYWPDNVIHKEPDHIDRNARTALLVHLIMGTPQPQIKSPHETGPEISANDLFLALEEKRNDFKADRWEIIKEIIRAREQIEMFRDGGFDGDTTIHVPDFSERSARGETDGEGEDNDFPAPEPASADVMGEGGPEDGNGTTAVVSTVPSPSQLVQDDIPQVGQYHQDTTNHDSERDIAEQSTVHHATRTFPSAANSFSNDSTGQESSPLVMDRHPFAVQLKRDRSSHRLHQLRVPHHSNGFHSSSNRQHQHLLDQQWISSESPNSYTAPGYTPEHLHTQAQISPQHYRMPEDGLMHGDMQDISMLDGMQFNGFAPQPRALPARTVSTPHPIMLDHGIHGAYGLGVLQPTFYAG